VNTREKKEKERKEKKERERERKIKAKPAFPKWELQKTILYLSAQTRQVTT
jgi:hypothetical protein